jgi:DNA polymerase V
LFDIRDSDRTQRLMLVLDRINREHGRGTLRIGAAAPFELMPGRTVAWRGRCERRSPRYTTRWEELPVARAQPAAQTVG